MHDASGAGIGKIDTVGNALGAGGYVTVVLL